MTQAIPEYPLPLRKRDKEEFDRLNKKFLPFELSANLSNPTAVQRNALFLQIELIKAHAPKMDKATLDRAKKTMQSIEDELTLL